MFEQLHGTVLGWNFLRENKKMGINKTNNQTTYFPHIDCITYPHPSQCISTTSFHYWNSHTQLEGQTVAICTEEMSVQRGGS
jgi:hypothetical protein